MRYAVLCLSIIFICFGSFYAQSTEAGFNGKLNTELLPNDNFNMTVRFVPATVLDKRKLPTPIAVGDQVFVRTVKWLPEIGQPLAMMLVEPPNSAPYIYVDINLDGAFTPSERFAFPAFKENPTEADDLVINLPYNFFKTIYKSYPITLRPYRKEGTNREVSYSNKAYATGVVQIGNQKTLVRYGIDAKTGKVDPVVEGLGMDTNGDGRIDDDPNSIEMDYGNHGIAIFHVSDKYVSTQTIDSVTGAINLKLHPAAEYERIELTAGSQLPDFSFTDLNGKTQKLSDFRGKYVLLDFWGTWCAPCLAEVPFLKDLHKKFRTRNFEIIGMDNESGWDGVNAVEIAKTIEKSKTFITLKGIEWKQARTDSINDLINRRFRVRSYPMKVLLDPQGRVIRRFEENDNKDLVTTLEQLLPAAQKN